MTFDFSSIFFIVIALMALQPLLMGRWYAMRRAQAIRAVEKEHGTRVITMIHRQERRSFFGFAVSRHIDLEDAQTVIAAIKAGRIPTDKLQTLCELIGGKKWIGHLFPISYEFAPVIVVVL